MNEPDGGPIGRDHELAHIGGFLAMARTDGGALLLTGEPGVGKTRLLEAAAAAASSAGTRVIRAAGVEFEAAMSFSGLNQLLLPLLAELPRLPAIHRDALNVALGFAEGPSPGPLVLCNAALVLLRQAATRDPLLIVLDDLPWLDRASAGVLTFVARRLEGSPVGLLAASRSGETDFFDHTGLPELQIGRLADAEARRLLDLRFPGLGATARDRVVLEAQGNPLALLELPAALDDATRTSTALPSTLPLGRRLHELFGSRIATLPAETRRLLLLMALDGTGDIRVLEARGAADTGLDDLAPAEEARLAYLHGSTHRLAFHHPLIRSAVVDLTHAHERRAAHRVLADLWSDQPERRAWHLAEGTLEPDESVAASLQAAAIRIRGKGDAVGCVKVLTRAAELSPAVADRRRRLAAAAYVGAEMAGDLGDASRVLADLRRGDTSLERSLQASLAASTYLLNADGDVATAHRLLVDAIEDRDQALDHVGPAFEETLNALMMVCFFGGDADRWAPFDATMTRLEAAPGILRIARATFGDPARSAGPDLPSLDAAIRDLADETDPATIVRTAIAAVYVDRLDGCRDALWRVVRYGREGSATASGINALMLLAYDGYGTGRWDEALALADEGITRCDAHGYRLLRWPGQLVHGLVAASRGEVELTSRLVAEMTRWAGPRGVRSVEWYAWHVSALAALGRGEFEEAYRLASRISPAGTLAPFVPHALAVSSDLVEAAVHAGREADARAHVAAMHEAGLAALSTRLALVVAGADALVAPDEEAHDRFRAVIGLPEVHRWPFDLARVRLAYGERLRRQRAMSEARVHLDAALETFERLGAGPWATRATTELRATGRVKPRAGESVLDRLTPQEYEIARLAASGLTNRQIGERLFLSHRTVGGHLHRAFPKLGVATRAALRDALEALPPDQLPQG